MLADVDSISTPVRSRIRTHSGARSLTDPDAELASAIEGLRRDLADLAFVLERQGSLDAADLAISVSARLKELADPNARMEPVD